MKTRLFVLALLLGSALPAAADNFSMTPGSGLTFGAKNIGGILYPWQIPTNSGGTELFTIGNGAYVRFPSAQQVTFPSAQAVTVATNPLPVVQTSAYPNGATVITASATGTTAATTATLAGASSVTTYVCGFSIRANATAAVTGNATVTGTISGTLNFTQWTAPAASGVGVVEELFTPCVPASATNTAIAVVSAAPGTGGTVSVTAWGFRL